MRTNLSLHISVEVLEICGHGVSTYHTVRHSGVMQTLYADVGTGLLQRSQLSSQHCFLTLKGLTYGEWMFLNLTYIEVKNAVGHTPYLKISNTDRTRGITINQHSVAGIYVSFIVDDSFLFHSEYLVRFYLGFGNSSYQALRLVLSYTGT